MTKNRLSPSLLQKYSVALSAVICAVHDFNVRYGARMKLSTRGFKGTARFVKDLLALPHTSDLSVFEVQLKRRIVRMNHKILGVDSPRGPQFMSVCSCMPRSAHQVELNAYENAAKELLKHLGDVDIKSNHQHLQSVQQILAANPATLSQSA